MRNDGERERERTGRGSSRHTSEKRKREKDSGMRPLFLSLCPDRVTMGFDVPRARDGHGARRGHLTE